MATMRTQVRRVELNVFALLVGGLLVAVLAVVGITELRSATQPASVPQAVASLPAASIATTGGRLGGMASSDSATDWQEHQGLTSLSIAALPPAGGRLGGIANADGAVDGRERQSIASTDGADILTTVTPATQSSSSQPATPDFGPIPGTDGPGAPAPTNPEVGPTPGQ